MGTPTTILCVDDEAAVLFTQTAILQAAGFRVFTAESGVEAISIFQAEQVDVVIMDYSMAGMNGITAAKKMKELKPNVPIIIVSAYAELLDETLGLADAWIRKGQEEPASLVARLTALTASRESKPAA
jgi:CheY-like chemotaxis protein